jgi:hypothetical protein
MGRVDDHEHFGSEIGALPSNNNKEPRSERFDRVFLAEEVQCGKAMLPVDDQIFAVRLAQKANAFEESERRKRKVSSVNSRIVPGMSG